MNELTQGTCYKMSGEHLDLDVNESFDRHNVRDVILGRPLTNRSGVLRFREVLQI